MKFHEPIDVGCKSINAILHDRESLIHIFAEIINIKLDKLNAAIYLVKSFVDLLKSCVYLVKSFVDLLKSCVHLAESFIDPAEPPIRLSKSSPNKSFERRELLIDSARLLKGALLRHVLYLAALRRHQSQGKKPSHSLLFDAVTLFSEVP